MAKLPYMQFYPADYLVDTMPLTPASRGIWMDVICMMWRSESRGSMTLPLEGWCKCLRCDKATFELTTWEFRQFGICDLVTHGNGNVTLRCRRMLREEKARKSLVLRVRKHRSNAACNATVPECNRDISESDIRSQNQKSESEEELIKKETTLSSAGTLDPAPPPRNYRAEAKEVLSFLNLKTGRDYRPVESTLTMIMARLRGQNPETEVDVQTCKSLIARKARDWLNDEKMNRYLRPETLFNRTKFESYLGELCTVQNATEPSPTTRAAVPAAGGHLRSL